MHSSQELNSLRVKYLSESIIQFIMSFTSYWSAPSNISCMISGTREPSHTWKQVSSLRMESRLTPYSFEISPETSSFSKAQCRLWVALSAQTVLPETVCINRHISVLYNKSHCVLSNPTNLHSGCFFGSHAVPAHSISTTALLKSSQGKDTKVVRWHNTHGRLWLFHQPQS